MRQHAARWTILVVAVITLSVANAAAQPIATLHWQLLPFCNVVTLNVTGLGSVFTLDGFDDQCGAGQRASVVGTAFVNPDGTIGIGLNTVLAPGGAFVHVDARIGLGSLGGTWRDSSGNSGSFIFTPGPSIGGPLRPVAPNGIAPGSITSAQIAPGSITNAQIVPGAVNGTTIADGSITRADIFDAPRAAFVSGSQNTSLTTAPVVVRSVTLTTPTAGTVIANASGQFFFAGAGADAGRCVLNTGTDIDSNHFSDAIEGEPSAFNAIPFGLTRGFTVAAGSFTVNLVCSSPFGAVFVQRPSLTALFVAGS